jgi:phospholipase C
MLANGIGAVRGARALLIGVQIAALSMVNGPTHGGTDTHGGKELPRYAHIFVIVAENKGYQQIVGPDSLAPNLNELAKRYGLATHFYAEVHPSEGNYVAMLGGNTFGIHDDDAFYCTPGMHDPWCPGSGRGDYLSHTVDARSLMDQLQSRGLSWKGYLESIPEPGSLAVRWPTAQHPVDGVPAEVYAAKHNGFLSFRGVQQDPQRAQKIVGFDQLGRDIDGGHMPNYAQIVPNQCNDMHGRDAGTAVAPDCSKSNLKGLITRGDRVIGGLVRRIMNSPVWSEAGNAAIVITFDENDKDERHGVDQGCCGYEPDSSANFGGGRIPTIVITNHGPQGIIDDRPYNHYSLLRTTEAAFGIDEYLGHAADEHAGVVSMTSLFAVKP